MYSGLPRISFVCGGLLFEVLFDEFCVRSGQELKNPARMALSKVLLHGENAILCKYMIMSLCLCSSYTLLACANWVVAFVLGYGCGVGGVPGAGYDNITLPVG